MAIKWDKIPFGYKKTNYNTRCYFKNGKWGVINTSDSEHVDIHIAATCLHYGQEAFEGLKAFRGADGKIRIFRWEENWKRMNSSADAILMEKIPKQVFFESMKKVIELNEEFIPPYNSGASLYIRPLLIGTGAQIGVKPADEYLFMILVTPVGPYFKAGFKPVNMIIERDSDRAAPLGTGHVKVGGNYAAGLKAMQKAHKGNYASVIFLDAKEKKYIDECGPANFFGIKNNTYITPKSETILPSITNKSLIELSKHLGLKTERRAISLEEIDSFEEIGACGTAAVISPVGRIDDPKMNKSYIISKNSKVGEVSIKLYNLLRAIQEGDEKDIFDWITVL